MRWLVTLGALALVGCGVRNPQFQDAQAESSSGPGYTSDPNTTGGPKPDPTGAPHTSGTGNPTGPIDPPEPVTTSSESGAEETNLGSADATSGIGSSGMSGEPVVLVFASSSEWASGEALDPLSVADQLCEESSPTECWTSSLAVLRAEGQDFYDAFEALGAEDFEVFTRGQGPSALIASTFEDLLTAGPSISLADGGVGTDSGQFWTGGSESEPEHCNDWSASARAEGRTGDFTVAGPDWLNGTRLACDQPLPLLCACLTDENPFL